MRLINKTSYDTAELRAILIAVHNEEAKHRGRLKTWNRLTVTIRRRSTYGMGDNSGFAYFHGRQACLTLPMEVCNVASLAAVWLHELQHLYGIRHPDMAPAIRHCLYADSVLSSWVKAALAAVDGRGAIQERQSEPQDPETAKASRALKLEAVVMRRYTRVLAAEARWAAKLKRAQTALQEYRTKRRYYESRFEKAAKLKEG